MKMSGLVAIIILTLGIAAFMLVPRGIEPSKKFIQGDDYGKPPVVTVKGTIDESLTCLVKEAEVVKLLRSRYRIKLEYSSAPSGQLRNSTNPQDFLWFAGSQEGEAYNLKHPGNPKTENLFSTPLVFYVWTDALDALVRNGTIQKVDGAYVLKDFNLFWKMLQDKKKWSELGLNSSNLTFTIESASPSFSLTGNAYAAYVAGQLAGNGIASDQSLSKSLSSLQAYFDSLGVLDKSDSFFFANFLAEGQGVSLVASGFERQLLSFANVQDEVTKAKIQQQLRVVYPQPTLVLHFQMMSFTPLGDTLIKALQDPDVARIAFQKCGLRTSNEELQKTLSGNALAGTPALISQTVEFPSLSVTDTVSSSIKN